MAAGCFWSGSTRSSKQYFSGCSMAARSGSRRRLEPVYYEQLAAERRVVRYVRGRPVRRFERKTSRSRAEALDCLVYNFAARSGLTIPLDQREHDLHSPDPPTPPPTIYRSRFMRDHGF